MRGFWEFLRKEALEIVRTWRIWVLPLMLIGLAALSPITAEFTPALLESVAGDQPGVVFEIPEPTIADAYLQWSKNLAQIVLIAVLISMAGTLSGERRSGTAVLVLTKPVSRAGMVVAKLVSNVALLVGSTAVGAAVCWVVAQVFFENELGWSLVRTTLLWLALATFFVCLTTALSAWLDSQAGAAGLGLVAYLIVAVLSGWGPARDYTTAGLLSAGDRLMLGEHAAVAWPLAVTALLCVALAAAAMWGFARREL